MTHNDPMHCAMDSVRPASAERHVQMLVTHSDLLHCVVDCSRPASSENHVQRLVTHSDPLSVPSPASAESHVYRMTHCVSTVQAVTSRALSRHSPEIFLVLLSEIAELRYLWYFLLDKHHSLWFCFKRTVYRLWHVPRDLLVIDQSGRNRPE